MIIRLPAVSADIQSESSVDLVLIICWYYLMITCSSCWYSVRFISWPCVDTQWLSDDYMLFLLIFSQNYQLTLMITCCSSWYSVRIISWPCIDNMLIYSDYLMITCCFCWYSVRIISWPWLILCWYTVIIWWLPAVPADIQSLSSVDHVAIHCWYAVFSWRVPLGGGGILSGSVRTQCS